MVSFPRQFKPLLDQELGERGFFTYRDLMGHILAEHFGVEDKYKPMEPKEERFKEAPREQPGRKRVVEPWEREE